LAGRRAAGFRAKPFSEQRVEVSPEIFAVLDALSDFVLLVEPPGVVAAANHAFSNGFGLSARAITGRKLADLTATPPDRLARYLRQWSASREPTPGVLVFRLPNGATLECPCEGAALPLSGDYGSGDHGPDDHGEPTILLRCQPKVEPAGQAGRKIAELRREITASRHTEQELQERNTALAESVEQRDREFGGTRAQLRSSERQFRHLVEGVIDYAIFMLDPEGFVTTWNPGAERIKGYAAGEIIGQHFSRFYRPEDRAAGVPKRALATAVREGRFLAEGWRVRKDGSLFWASVVIDAIRQGGTLIGFAKVTRDLTERRAAEEHFRQVQKMEAVGQLTGGIAHDFNNMLTVIGGNLESLQRHLDPNDASRHRLVDAALRGVSRATTLTSRLLAFSRRQPLDPKPVEVNRLVIAMSDLLVRTLGEHITVETVLSGGVWTILADPNQLESTILNLAVNSRDAMARGGTLTIETANTELGDADVAANDEVLPGQYVKLTISDTGTGMSAETLERAFEPFFTTKGIGEGTGLGLSQVYGFIKQSGGHVKLSSTPGEGTSVQLYLPRATAFLAASAEPAPAVVMARPGETILVVEDDADVRAYSGALLRELGYTVLEAADADAGLSRLSAHPEIRLLFTDVGLPGALNGRGLADEARRLRPDLRVLFTTGYARDAIVHQGRLDPDIQLILKPFTFPGLAARVRRMLDGEA